MSAKARSALSARTTTALMARQAPQRPGESTSRRAGPPRAAGLTSLGGAARALKERGNSTARGGTVWSAVQVQRVLARMPG